jgi:uncharacterized membrane protein YczE
VHASVVAVTAIVPTAVLDSGTTAALSLCRAREPRRLAQLLVGLMLYGASDALMLRARLGLDPWTTFHLGLSRLTGLSVGTWAILVGVVVLLGWWPLRQQPAVGTVCNVVLIGVALDVVLGVLPTPHAMVLRVLFLAGGVVGVGLATGLYIGAGLGPGPRDGLMTGLARRTGASVRVVRTGIELTVLVSGWFLGGTVGIGTVVFAASIGPLVQFFLGRLQLARSPV